MSVCGLSVASTLHTQLDHVAIPLYDGRRPCVSVRGSRPEDQLDAHRRIVVLGPWDPFGRAGDSQTRDSVTCHL